MIKTMNRKTFTLVSGGGIPESRNFSEMTIISSAGEAQDFDAGDDGVNVDTLLSAMQADANLIEILSRLNDRQKIIFLLQLVRASGYDLNHEECAKTLSLTREHYMVLLKQVRIRVAKILQIPY